MPISSKAYRTKLRRLNTIEKLNETKSLELAKSALHFVGILGSWNKPSQFLVSRIFLLHGRRSSIPSFSNDSERLGEGGILA